MLQKIAPWIIALLALAGLFFGTYKYGYQMAVADMHTQQLADAQQTITDLNTSAAAANAANLALGKTIGQLQNTGNETTRSIRNALKATADQRINCVLPAGVLRDLEEARQRANGAAASGLNDPVPPFARPSG